jgi:hypothetical protein
MDREILISELIGEAYPTTVTLESGRLRRSWIARTVEVLPPEGRLSDMQRALEEDAFMSIKKAYSSSATPQALVDARPSVHLARLDDHHLVVRIEFAGPEKTVGDAAAISQWGVLQAIDRELRLEELQGLPCEHWFPLRVAREGKAG